MNPSLIPKSIHKMYLEGLNGLLVCEAMERLSIYFKNFITWKEEYTGTYTYKSKGCMQTFGHSWSKFPFVITSKSYKVMGNIIIKFRFFQLFYIFIFYIYKIKSNKRGPVFSFFCNKLSVLLWAIMTDSSVIQYSPFLQILAAKQPHLCCRNILFDKELVSRTHQAWLNVLCKQGLTYLWCGCKIIPLKIILLQV